MHAGVGGGGRNSRSRRVVDSGMGSPMSPSGVPVFEMIARVIEVSEHCRVQQLWT